MRCGQEKGLEGERERSGWVGMRCGQEKGLEGQR